MGPRWKRAKGGSGGPLEGGAHFTCCPWASGRGCARRTTVPCWPVTHGPPDHLQLVPRGLDTRAVRPWASHALLSGNSQIAMMMEGSELLAPTPSPSCVRTLGPGCSLAAGADSADCLATFRAWGFSRAPLPTTTTDTQGPRMEWHCPCEDGVRACDELRGRIWAVGMTMGPTIHRGVGALVGASDLKPTLAGNLGLEVEHRGGQCCAGGVENRLAVGWQGMLRAVITQN